MRKKRNENSIMNVTSYIPCCTNEYQRVRISEHPLQIGNMVVVDQLETNGILRILNQRKKNLYIFSIQMTIILLLARILQVKSQSVSQLMKIQLL